MQNYNSQEQETKIIKPVTSQEKVQHFLNNHKSYFSQLSERVRKRRYCDSVEPNVEKQIIYKPITNGKANITKVEVAMSSNGWYRKLMEKQNDGTWSFTFMTPKCEDFEYKFCVTYKKENLEWEKWKADPNSQGAVTPIDENGYGANSVYILK